MTKTGSSCPKMALAERISEWVRKHHFEAWEERVALQFPDALLGEAPEILEQVCEKLKDRRVFILGDSSFGGGGVDEVGARHYGADCIVRFGHAEQQRGGDLPVLFVFDEQIAADCVEDAEEIVKRVHGLFAKRARVEGDDMDAHLLVLCDLPQQYMAEPLGQALVESFGKFLSSHPSEARWQVLVATPHQEAFSGDIPTGWRDWRFGALQLGQAWWSTLGTLTLAGAARPPRLKVCGRDVYALGSGADTQPSMGRTLPPNSAVLYVGPKGSSLERCALLRYGASCPVWSLERLEAESPHVGARLERIFSHALLQKRYRFVELAKAAGTIGLLMVSAGGPTTLGKALAERLEALLSKANRQSYRLVVGQPTQEKLGNFPEIECYVLLSGPEQFMWDLRDFMVPICTPFELEVALGAREWTGEYLTDLQELLDTAPMTEVLPNTVSEDATLVQSLGTKIRSFESNGPLLRPKSTVTETSTVTEMKAPASITPGLYGVPWKYSQEGLSRSEVDN